MTQLASDADQLSQLKNILKTPVVVLRPAPPMVNLPEIRKVLETSEHCSIVSSTSESGRKKLDNLKSLYSSLSALKRLRRELSRQHSISNISLVGIYPSLQYPACVYELGGSADRYVSANVLPGGGSVITRTIKSIVARVLGVNPAVGGLGLIVYKD